MSTRSGVVAVIPARYGSTRFPAKALAPICGKPMIQWTYERAASATLIDRVIVATDDQRILDAVTAVGGEARQTTMCAVVPLGPRATNVS